MRRETRWQQNTESSEEADESQKVPVFVKRFQEAETAIKRFELEKVAKFAPWKTDKAFGKGFSSYLCLITQFFTRNLDQASMLSQLLVILISQSFLTVS